MKCCQFCGGVLGRDCFNEYDCGQITYQMQNDAQAAQELQANAELIQWAQQNPEAWEALRTGRAGVYGIVESDCWYDGKVPLIGSRIDTPFKSEAKEGA